MTTTTRRKHASAQVHPTAVVQRGARLGEGVVVGPHCHVGAHVTLGDRTQLVSHVVVLGRTTLGCDNRVWPFATVGADPQDLKYRGEESELIVGDRNEIRESVTLHLGTENGGGVTRIGSDNLLMVGAHVAHDCVVGSHVLLANNVGLSGHVHVHDHANVAGAVGVHHFVSFGSYCYVGGMSRVVHDVPPYMKVEGNPARVRALNDILLHRAGVPGESIDRLKDVHRRLFRGHAKPQSETTTEGQEAPATLAGKLDAIQNDFARDPYVQNLAQFIRNTLKSPMGRYLETLRKDNRKANPTK